MRSVFEVDGSFATRNGVQDTRELDSVAGKIDLAAELEPVDATVDAQRRGAGGPHRRAVNFDVPTVEKKRLRDQVKKPRPNQDELKTFLNVIRPKGFVPIHGEYRHLRAHAELATEMGVPDVTICEDGDRIVIDGDKTRYVHRAVDASYVYYDGSGVGDIHRGVLRDRSHLADDGVVVITVGVRLSTCEVILGNATRFHS